MSTIRHILEVKGNDVWTVSPDATVYEALKTMSDKGVGALLVIENGQLVGVVSERDYARKIILEGKTKTTQVREVMTAKVITIHPEQTVQECMEILDKNNIRHLPVIEDNQLIGVISQRDVLRDLLYQQRETIKNLEEQISGVRSLST